MAGLVFEVHPPITPQLPRRADVTCFIGLVGRRSTPIPLALEQWLKARGWDAFAGIAADGIPLHLTDRPVPIESWEMFDQLFAWDRRPVFADDDPHPPAPGTLAAREQFTHTYLGAAVRSFFAQGGRRCYVVRVGDPLPLTASRADRHSMLAGLLPGYPQRLIASSRDRATWRGIGHLYGLPEVSYVSLPDLPDLVADERTATEVIPLPVLPEQFVACSSQDAEVVTDLASRPGVEAPRCDRDGYATWAAAIGCVASLLRGDRRDTQLREMQLVAAVPLPGADAEQALPDLLARGDDHQPPTLASAFVQLVYPWVRTPGSQRLPGRLESPEGVLAGVLARNALSRGSFSSAAGLSLADVEAVSPILTSSQLLTPHQDSMPHGRAGTFTLLERISVLGPTPAGLRLLSDVTTSPLESYRPAGVNRLVAALVRAARELGETVAFEPSAESLWGRIKGDLDGLLTGLWLAGALAGATPAEAFSVRCDRSTTSQADLDQGRVIAEVQFTAALPIEQIRVVLAMSEGGQASLISPPP